MKWNIKLCKNIVTINASWHLGVAYHHPRLRLRSSVAVLESTASCRRLMRAASLAPLSPAIQPATAPPSTHRAREQSGAPSVPRSRDKSSSPKPSYIRLRLLRSPSQREDEACSGLGYIQRKSRGRPRPLTRIVEALASVARASIHHRAAQFRTGTRRYPHPSKLPQRVAATSGVGMVTDVTAGRLG